MSAFLKTLRTLTPAQLSKYKNNVVRVAVRYTSAENCKGHKISIPNRIHRKPTDILRALSNSIKRDPTAPNYKYVDDPFLIPVSNQMKRVYALSKESGRKAARWIRNEHSDLFNHKEAEPFIKAFAPRVKYEESEKVSEVLLQEKCISGEVEDSIQIYELLKSKNTAISEAVLQSFLELLCFNNSEPALEGEWLEEMWFKRNYKQRERQRKTWKDDSLAEKVFSQVTPNSASYGAMIQGLCRYSHASKAWEYYEIAIKEGISLDTETYNSMFSIVNILRSGPEEKWSLVEDILNSMKGNQVGPNLNTFNSILEVASNLAPQRLAKLRSLQILKEMKNFNVKPSLATYYFLLLAYCRDKGPTSSMLDKILDEIEGVEFAIAHPKDTFFFPTAMDVCNNHIQNISTAYRVNELLLTGNNYALLGDSYKESVYYRNFFQLLCSSVTITELFDEYYKYIPNIYTPEPSVILAIINTIDAYAALEFLPIIWSDVISFNQEKRQNILEAITQTIVNSKPTETLLKERLSIILEDIMQRLDQQDLTRTNNAIYTSELMSNIIEAYLVLDKYADASRAFLKFRFPNEICLGMISANCVKRLLVAAQENTDSATEEACLQYCIENSYTQTES